MRIRCIIKILLLSTILSSCGNINNYTNDEMNLVQNSNASVENEYYGAAEPPVRCGESHLSGLTEPLRSL